MGVDALGQGQGGAAGVPGIGEGRRVWTWGGVGEGRRCRHPLGVGITEDRDTELYLGLSGYCAAAPSPPEALLPVGHLAITSFPEQAEGGRGWDRCQRERASGLGGTSPAGPPGRRSPRSCGQTGLRARLSQGSVQCVRFLWQRPAPGQQLPWTKVAVAGGAHWNYSCYF